MRQPVATPARRTEVVGAIPEIIDDCTLAMQNEIRVGDTYIFVAEDTSAWSDYTQFLTTKELRRCFRNARQQAEQA